MPHVIYMPHVIVLKFLCKGSGCSSREDIRRKHQLSVTNFRKSKALILKCESKNDVRQGKFLFNYFKSNSFLVQAAICD